MLLVSKILLISIITIPLYPTPLGCTQSTLGTFNFWLSVSFWPVALHFISYAEIVLLVKTLYMFRSLPSINFAPNFQYFFCTEWEWGGGIRKRGRVC